MAESREEWLARTFVELADTLVADFDLIDFLSVLSDGCVQLLATVEVGLSLSDLNGRLQVMLSSTERMRVLESFEVQNDQGPCLECYRSGRQVLNQRLELYGEKWPRFTPIAVQAGFQMVHAFPLRLRAAIIGVMNVFDVERRELTSAEVNLVQALADAATIGILQERTVKERTDLSVQLQGALNSRIVIEQAKGIVVEREHVAMEEAFAMLRAYARSHGAQLSDVARAVIDGSLTAADLSAAHDRPSPTGRSERLELGGRAGSGLSTRLRQIPTRSCERGVSRVGRSGSAPSSPQDARAATWVAVGQRTLVAHPSCSNTRMRRAARSTWCGSTPCRADAGAQWWKLCQLSPKEARANAATLVLLSVVSKGRRPQMWQTELMLHVTWWRTAIRTRPAHRKALNAPATVPSTIQPMVKGKTRENTARTGNRRSIRTRSGSRRRSGAKRLESVWSAANSHPT